MGYKDTEQDITEVGIGPLQGIDKTEAQEVSDSGPIRIKKPKNAGQFQFDLNPYDRPDYGKFTEDVDFGDTKNRYGTSRFDPSFITEEQLNNLEDTRARNQSDFSKIVNGIGKGITTAGTTFLNGTIGLVVGLGTGVVNLFDNNENSSFVSGIWDNCFNNLMNKANEKMEEVLPNYYTNEEKEHPMQHLFNANFIGDKFIKNFGFTVGALGSAVAFGNVYGSVGHIVGKAALGLGTAGKTAVGISKAVQMGSRAVASAVAEGSIEALQTAKQMDEQNEELYRQQRDQNIAKIESNPDLTGNEKALLIADEERKYNEAKTKLVEDRTKAGNLDLLLNIPILTASNIFQFNKLLSNGYRSATRVAKVTGKAAKEAGEGAVKAGGFLEATKAQRVAKALGKSALAEGNEEVAQQIASDMSNNLYSLQLNDYYKSVIDPQANTEATDYIKATGQQILTTLGREDTWEQFIIGGLTGALGMPVFGKNNTQRKADIGKGNAVGISGGFFGQLNEINEAHERNQTVVDYINNRMQDPEFKKQYQGLVKHIFFENKQNAALEQGLEKEFKDWEYAKLYNDVMMFMSAGKKDTLVDMIKDAMENIDDEQAMQIIKDTTTKSKGEDGAEITTGPFIKDGKPMDADAVREHIRKNGQEILDTVNGIENAYDELDYITKGNLSNEQLEQLTYMQMQSKNWMQRTKEVGKDTEEFFKGIKESLQGRLDANKARLEANPNDSAAQENIKALEENIKSVDSISNQIQAYANLEKLGALQHKEARRAYYHAIDTLNSKYVRGLVGEDELANYTGKLKDLIKMSHSMEMFMNKRNEYIKNPNLITTDSAEVLKQMEEADLEERAKNVADNLASKTSIDGIDEVLDDLNNEELGEKALDDLVKSGNQMAKQYKNNRAVAEGRTKDVEKLAEKNTEIPTRDGGKTVVTGEDADDIGKILEFRRRFVGLEDGKFNSRKMEDPSLSDLDNVDSESGTDYWWQVLSIDKVTEEGLKSSEHLRDVFAYVMRTGIEETTKNAVVDDSAEEESIVDPEDLEELFPTTGADGVTEIPPTPPPAPVAEPKAVNESGSGQVENEDMIEQAKEDDLKLIDRGKKLDSEAPRGTQRDYWKNNIPEYGAKEMKEGKISPPLIDGSPMLMVGVLTDLGAYEYVDKGNLKKGDAVKFVINPKWTEHARTLTSDPEIQQQLEKAIFIVKESDGQVVGVLPALNGKHTSEYKGLENFIETAEGIYDEAVQKGETIDETKGLDLKVRSKVKEIMNGFILYGAKEEMQDGENVTVPVKKSLKDFKAPFTFTVKERNLASGAKHKVLHMHIENCLSEPLVHIARHTQENLDSGDEGVKAFYRHFRSSLSSVIKKILEDHRGNYVPLSDDEAAKVRKAIQEFVFLFTGEVNAVHINPYDNGMIIRVGDINLPAINFFSGSKDNVTRFSTTQQSQESSNVRKVTSWRSEENITDDFINALLQFNLPIQVDFTRIGDSAYMQERINAGFLTTSVASDNPNDVWFTIEPAEFSSKDNGTSTTTEEQTPQETAVQTPGENAATVAEAAESPKETPIPESKPETKREVKEPEKRGKKRFRIADRKEWKAFKREEELKWLDRVLPQLSKGEKVRFVKGLIDVAEQGKKAWGKFDKGIVTLSDIAAEGTVYHEAFHAVFNTLLSSQERADLFNEARKLWHKVDDEISLEEKMAEEFRRYVAHKQENLRPKTLLGKVGRFFRDLWEKVRSWRSEVMYNYFAMINDGTYAGRELQETDAIRLREYNPDNIEEVEAFNRLNDIWKNGRRGRNTYYKVGNEFVSVPVIRRNRGGIEFRFNTKEEANMFQDFWRKEAYATFSPLWYDKDNGNYRVYMHKPTLMSEADVQEIRRLSEPQISDFDKLADYQKSELTARGYTAEDFNALSESEQEAIKECFFVL